MNKDVSTNTNKENEIKVQALIDNTAQGIFNYLKEIENKREVYEKRWIWELLQNALDAAPAGQKIEIQLMKDNNKLTFMHGGRPFKPEELAHLIYHGSTKRKDDIGKFGTGFLVTHLLSKQVNVKGVREDGKKFEFKLDRNGTSADDIKNLMEKTWEEYQKSLDTTIGAEYTAQFEYPLSDTSFNTVEIGINALIGIAPYVLAFNDELGVIKISDLPNELKFELIRETNESERLIKKVVKEEKLGNSPILHELWIARDNDVDIAIKVRREEDNSYQIEKLEDIPKIFIAFPLFGTQDLPFPVVVNSRKFEPTERRDGVFLGKEITIHIKQNKELFEKVIDLFIKLVSDSNRWKNLHALLYLQQAPRKDWLDQDWFTRLLKGLIDKVRSVQVVKTETGCIPYTNAYFPTITSWEKEKLERLWKLCRQFSTYKDKIPADDVAFEWQKIIDGWKSLGIDLTERQITIEKVATEIERSGRLQDFKTKLGNDVAEIGTLNDFYRLLLDVKMRELFDNKNILPDQNGNFKRTPNLFKDEGIDETLKDISNKLGVDVRNQLLHSSISEVVQNLLPPKKQEEVLNQVINKIKQSHTGDDQYIQANIDLFNWLLERDKFEYFEGYPVLSSKEKIFTSLSRKDKVLAPKDVWNETARIYTDLFPQDFIISSVYFEKVSQKNKWDKLRDSAFVLTDPLYKETEKLNGDDLALLSTETLEEDKDHEVVDKVELNKIAFFEVKDKGIIDTVRKSREKARKFLGFLFDYVIENDTQWVNPMEVNCKCGSKHKIYPTLWLGKLKERSWIPVRKDKSEQPNAKNLALLLKDDERVLEKSRQDKPSLLLNRLNISISELMMNVAAKDDKVRIELDTAMGSLFSTFMTDPSQLSKIAQLAQSDPGLFIEEMEERLSTREQIRRNQSIGSLVEKLLKSVLEKEGFKVEVTGVGSDFVIEHDFVKDNMETIFEVKKDEKIYSYIEVKATSQDFVRMTLTQANEAKNKIDKYGLCIILLNGLEINEEDVKNRAKFVMDIGPKIQDKVTKVENFKVEQEAISEEGDIEIEISKAPVRFKINKTVWEDGKTFEQFLEFLRGTKI